MLRVIYARSLKFSELQEYEKNGGAASSAEGNGNAGGGPGGGGSMEIVKDNNNNNNYYSNIKTSMMVADKTPTLVAHSIAKDLKRKNKKSQGVWSPLGHPYTTLGVPDLDLGDEIHLKNKPSKKNRRIGRGEVKASRRKLENLVNLFNVTKKQISSVNLFRRSDGKSSGKDDKDRAGKSLRRSASAASTSAHNHHRHHHNHHHNHHNHHHRAGGSRGSSRQRGMIRGGSGRRNSDYSTYDDDNYYDDSGEFIATADSEYDYDQYHDHGDFPGSSGMHSGRHQHRSHDSHRGHHHHRDYVHQQKAYEDMTTVERIAALGTRREKKVVVKESESVKFRHMDHLSESRITHITRWRDKFEEIKDSKDALLLERLENRKKDRVAVFEDPKLLKNAMRLVIEKERSHRKQLYNQSRRRHHLRASQYDDDTDSVASAASSRHSVHSANNTDKLNDSDHFDGDAAADNTAPMNLNLNMRMNKHNTTVQGSNRARHRKDAAMTRSASTPAFLRPSKRNHNTRHNKKQLNSSSIDARRQNWTYTHASIWDRAKTLKKSANGYSSDGAPGEYKYAPSVKFQTGGNGNSSANNSNSSDIHHRSKNSGGSIENNNNNHNNNNNNKGESASDNQDSRHTVMLKSKYHRRKSLHRATSKEVLLREGGFSTKGGRKLNNQSRHRNQRER